MDSNLRSPDRRGIAYALMAATLFGANTPVAHKLLEYVSPVLMAGLLYVGSGLGLSIWQLVRPGHGTERAEAP